MRIHLIISSFLLNVFFANGQQLPINVMPVPAHVTMKEGRFAITPSFTVAIKKENKDSLLIASSNLFYQTLNRRTGVFFNTQRIDGKISPDTASLVVTAQHPALAMMGIDESYTLEIAPNKISLEAPTTAGALHGLQTILQLVENHDGKYYLPCISITDAPRFNWRGFMIDASRHFIPVEAIERNLDAMAVVKMNVFHWHLTDDEGFRVESKLFPRLTGKGSNGEYYTQAEIREIVAYAKLRGIMVVPEFDMPGHTGSWFAGYPDLASAPGPYEPGPRFKNLSNLSNIGEIMKMINTTPTATMDPSRESTYRFLDQFFGEMASLFPSSYVHIGCDENNGVAWTTNPSIRTFMKQHQLADAHALQAYFAQRVAALLAKHGKKTIGWEEILSGAISQQVAIQVWSDGSYLKKAITAGNPVILSKGFYLDLFFPAYIHYNNDIIPGGTPASAPLIQGGEAALWSEAVDKYNVDTRAWPRTAAIAERLWSPESVKNVDDMYRRLFILNDQLDQLGLQQISAYEKGLRQITGGADIAHLKTLTDVLSPIKGYRKLFAKMSRPASYWYQTAPLQAVSDIIPVDSKTKRIFRMDVSGFLSTKDSAMASRIELQLLQWRDNHQALQTSFSQSEWIGQIRQHSSNLMEAAKIGLEALNKIKSGVQPSSDWITEKMNQLKEYRKSYAETELDVIPEIEALVKQQLAPDPASYPMF